MACHYGWHIRWHLRFHYMWGSDLAKVKMNDETQNHLPTTENSTRNQCQGYCLCCLEKIYRNILNYNAISICWEVTTKKIWKYQNQKTSHCKIPPTSIKVKYLLLVFNSVLYNFNPSIVNGEHDMEQDRFRGNFDYGHIRWRPRNHWNHTRAHTYIQGLIIQIRIIITEA